MTTETGPVPVKVLRVNDHHVDEETGERRRPSSKILPPWCRAPEQVSEVLPSLCLHRLSSGDFVPTVEQFLGPAAGRSSATMTRLRKQRSEDPAAFQQSDLSDQDFVHVYAWANGAHPKVRLGEIAGVGCSLDP